MVLGLEDGEVKIFEQKQDNSFVRVQFETQYHSSVTHIEVNHEKSLLYLGYMAKSRYLITQTLVSFEKSKSQQLVTTRCTKDPLGSKIIAFLEQSILPKTFPPKKI